MAYTPENNPYIPGDPYSYDLKWMVNRLKETAARIEAVNEELSAEISSLADNMQADINNWLDAHPEATTTVQDYSLTFSKLTTATYARIMQKNENFFTVGNTAQYPTISAGYQAAVDAGGGSILIMPGVYDEAITMAAGSDQYKINFIGIDRDATIWKSTTFGYLNACFTGSGNLTFTNLTMQKGETNSGSLGGYALHMDYPGTQGYMYVYNCRLISYENSAIGCGTRTNQHIHIENCLLESFKTSNTNTTLLYHTAPESGHSAQSFELIGNTIIDHTASGAIQILNSAANTYSFEPVIINNTVLSDIYTGSQALNYYNAVVSLSLVQTNSTLTLTYNKCYGNNHPKLNAANAAPYQNLVDPKGNCVIITDPIHPPKNNLFWQVPANTTTGVMPQDNHDFIGISVGVNEFYFMFCFDLSNGVWYRRGYRSGLDSGWVQINWN